MIFHGLAEHILKQFDKPLTANEIWQLAVDQGLDQKLNSSGKTPARAELCSVCRVAKGNNPLSLL
jgi:hypothetical protein